MVENHWNEHFVLEGAHLRGLTEIGLVTVKLLRLDEEERVTERAALQSIGAYPCHTD